MSSEDKKRKDWEDFYDYIPWEDFKENYFKCEMCGCWVDEPCICYAR